MSASGPRIPNNRRRMIRLPQWMDDFLTAESERHETTPSALIREAIRSRFFVPSSAGNAVQQVGTAIIPTAEERAS